MNILCFASTVKMLEKASRAVMGLADQGVSIELFQSLDDLYRLRLCEPKKSDRILFLCLKNKKEIEQIAAMHDELTGAKVILVLPKRDKDAIKTAYRISPRFLAFADEDFSDISRIIEKMISHAAGMTYEQACMESPPL